MCEACSPPKRSEDRVAVLVARDGVWTDESGWGGDPATTTVVSTINGQSPADAATSPHQPPRAAAWPTAAGQVAEDPGAFEAGLPDRVDPLAPLRLVIVDATRLEWFEATAGSFWGRGTFEVVETPCPKQILPPPGIWRRLSQPYFAWLLSAVERLSSGDRSEAMGILREIVIAAIEAEVFGDWAMVETLWPRRPPVGYLPPRGISANVPAGDQWLHEPNAWEENTARVRDRAEAMVKLKAAAGMAGLSNEAIPGKAA